MPAPNSAPSGFRSRVPDPAPVWRAWLSGRAYSFAAGDPASTWTPGSRPLEASAKALEQLIASATSAPIMDTLTARMGLPKITAHCGFDYQRTCRARLEVDMPKRAEVMLFDW